MFSADGSVGALTNNARSRLRTENGARGRRLDLALHLIIDLKLLARSLSLSVHLRRSIQIHQLLQLLDSDNLLSSLCQHCLLLVKAVDGDPCSLISLLQQALIIQYLCRLVMHQLLVLNLVLHLGHLLLHLGESFHPLLDLDLLSPLLQLGLHYFLFRPSPFC